MKACYRCGVQKPFADFSASDRDANGVVVRWRGSCRECERKRQRVGYLRALERAGEAATVENEQPMRLPIGPFREWLRNLLVQRDWTPTGASEILGLQADAVRNWLDVRESIELDQADRCFCLMGEPYLLRELYPDLYEFGDDEQVAA